MSNFLSTPNSDELRSLEFPRTPSALRPDISALQLSNPVIPINTFRSVSITKQKPLVLCDIDDTVIGYDKDEEYFYKRLKMYINNKKQSQSGPTNSFSNILNNSAGMFSMTDEEIKATARNMYDDYRQFNKPKHCDYDGFVDLLRRVSELGGELQFLTARHKQTTAYTRLQFDQIGLKYDDYRVHYTGNIISKGDYITRYFNLNHFGEVVFIDDLDSYIKSVVILCPSIQCYKFTHKLTQN
jgi:hypothetical protein